MTLASPTLFTTISTKAINIATYIDRKYNEVSADLFLESFNWTFYVMAPIIWLLISCVSEILQSALFVPKYAWDLFWHPDGRSIFRMLSDPEGKLDRLDDYKFDKHSKRSKASMHTHPRKWRRSWRSIKHDKSYTSTPTSFLDRGPPGKIVGYDSSLCMFSYYQMDRENINRCQTGSPRCDNDATKDATESASAFTEYYASTYFSATKIFCLKRPKEPPDGYIASLMVLIATIAIFSSFTIIASIRLSLMPRKKKRRRRRKRSSEAAARIRLKKGIRKEAYHDAENGRDQFHDSSEYQSDTAAVSSKSEGVSHKVFTTSLADVDLETLNTQVPFDTDSIFFVCDNSTTGHICNDIRKFVPGTIQNTMRRLTTANGTGPCLQEGTARIHLTDDDSKRHIFLLENCIYLPDSPVNLLSTRRLAEKFLDSEGNPDEETNITSRYSSHVLTWNHGRYHKTFPTPVSGLPELLFDEGFGNFDSYCSEVGSPIPRYSFLGATVVPYEEDEILHDNTLFMSDEAIKFKDGKGVSEQATYIEPVHLQDNSIKHKIVREDDKEYLVDGNFLSPLNEPEIGSVPTTVEQYVSELPNLTREQLQQIANPEILDADQTELLRLHCKMNHIPFPTLIRMAASGKHGIRKSLAQQKERVPTCMSCVFGMAHKRPWRSKGAPGSIRKESETEPGDCISIDQLVSAQPGLIPQMSGFLTNLRLWGATIFVDHVSNYVYVALMRDLTLDETLLAKTSFERHAQDGGVSIRAYRADNGRFADQGFRDAIKDSNQKITYCAVGAHHQNGIVERRIKELTLIARTLLLHAVRHWPGFITTMLWPFALKEAAYRLNKLTIDDDGRSNEAKFFGVDGDIIHPSLFHTFGSPCFALDARLQSGLAGPPKWEPRSRLGIYVGHSPSHAGSVALVLNPRTGHVSPQFHVVFDEDFTTVPFMDKNQVPPNWAKLVQSSRELVTEEQFDLANTWLSAQENPTRPIADAAISEDNNDQTVQATQEGENLLPDSQRLISNCQDSTDKCISAPASQLQTQVSCPDSTEEFIASSAGNQLNFIPSDATEDLPPSYVNSQHSATFNSSRPDVSSDCEGETLTNNAPQMINLATSGLRRSQRIHNQNSGPRVIAYTSTSRNERPFTQSFKTGKRLSFYSVFCNIGLLWSFCTTDAPHFVHGQCHSYVSRVSNDYERINGLFDDTINDVIHHVKAYTTSNENFTFSQMLKEDDYREFFQAMLDEISVHEERNHWTLMERRDMPIGAKTIMAIWSFKRKRFPDGSLNKHKARLCAHGGQQTWGQDYWDTYAPVVTWASVRLLLIVAKIHKLESKSIDFVLAFPQADLDIPVYMELPAGVVPADDVDENRRRYVLRLNKSLYGLKQAGHNWFEKLRKGLLDRGFIQSQVDKCVFFRDECIIVTYVDDCIIIGKTMSQVDSIITSLKEGDEDFELTDEGSIDKYLGVMIKDIDDKSFEMSQPFLARRILQFLSLDEHKTTGRDTPVGKPLLNKDLDGVPRKHPWVYRGAVGMLSYYCNSVRPEIQMAVHQTARFSVNPMRSHELAIVRIGRYLVNNPDGGIIYKVDTSKGLEVYADADFAGGWDKADSENADNVLSRTGFVICYANCPIIWCSKLQTEIALSTAEAEYIALSHALREAIPIQNLSKEINCVFPLHMPTPDFCLTVHEDNLSTIAMAESIKFTPRTKHIAIKYHHFRSRVQSTYNPTGDIRIRWVESKKQLADIFTKPLDDPTFFQLRHMLQGW